MRAYRVKKKVSPRGNIQLDALPFAVGETVEIIVLATSETDEAMENGAEATTVVNLKGSVLGYTEPTAPVAQDDWTAAS